MDYKCQQLTPNIISDIAFSMDIHSTWHLIALTVLLVCPILYQTSKSFKYYIKLAFYCILSFFVGIGVIIYSLPRPRSPKNHFFVTLCAKVIMQPLLGINVVVRGTEHLTQHEPLIIVVNHQSSLDMIPFFTMWPENCVSVAKRELIWTTGTFGVGAWMCGTVYINRQNPESTRKRMEEAVNLIKNRRLKVGIFPEGTRNRNGSLLPFKKGAFHLAVQAQVPIVPAVISSYDHFYSSKNKYFNEGTLLVEILPAIPTSGLTSSDVTSLADTVRDIMLECYERISQEVKMLK